jgi:mannosyl-oligosaccharide alpha-1,2-mannosidase
MMMPRRFWPLVGSVLFCVIVFFYFNPSRTPRSVTIPLTPPFHDTFTKPRPDTSGRFKWATRKENHPVPEPLIQLPKGNPLNIPRIQFAFNDGDENAHDRKERLARRDGIKKTFTRTWEGYKNHAWMKDELMPLSGGGKNYFGGWAATLIDSLDTLWIMDKRTDFDQAVANIGDIDFSSTGDEELNVFETTIRYLGGLISAYELSNQQYPVLLEKAIDLGNLLYAAFDTPNRMPITRWKWQA